MGEQGGREVHYHYSQSKDGNGNGSKLTNLLLAVLLAVIAFMGAQVWRMNERLSRIEGALEVSDQQ